jgi:TRAP-type uncharacterized transport system substrate-binding protein
MYERKKRPPVKKAALKPLMPARTEEELEKRAVGLATKLAIEQMRNGTASSQIITHFLKLGSLKEQAELEKTKHEIELLKAKKKAIESAEEQDRKYQEVIQAIASYTGKDNEWEEVPDDYPD